MGRYVSDDLIGIEDWDLNSSRCSCGYLDDTGTVNIRYFEYLSDSAFDSQAISQTEIMYMN